MLMKQQKKTIASNQKPQSITGAAAKAARPLTPVVQPTVT